VIECSGTLIESSESAIECIGTRIRRHDGAKLVKRGSANGFGLFGESATLRVDPSNAPLVKLLAERLVLGLEVLDD
jgi:hypothetical protein